MRTNELTNNYRGIGIIAADPELRDAGEHKVCNLRVAVPGLAGRHEPFGFLDLAVWGAPGQACAEHLTRHMTITFTGALELRAFQRKDGSDGHALRIASATVQFPPRPPRPNHDPLLDDTTPQDPEAEVHVHIGDDDIAF